MAGISFLRLNFSCPVCAGKGQADVCKTHQEQLILFCEKPQCQTPACVSCPKDDHKGHEFDSLQKSVENWTKKLMVELESFNNISKFSRMGNDQKSETCIEQIEVARERTLGRLNEKCDELVSEANERKIEIETKLDDATEKIKLQMEERRGKQTARCEKYEKGNDKS